MLTASVSAYTLSVVYVFGKLFTTSQYVVSVPPFWQLGNDLHLRAFLEFKAAVACFFVKK